jgi:hypothetical protein
MAAAWQQSPGMNITKTVLSLAGRSLSMEATSAHAQSAIFPAIAHLASAPHADGRQMRWTIVEEDVSWRPRAFAGTGAYRIQSGGFAVVQTDPASFECYRPEVGIELRAAPAALAGGDLRAHPACYSLAAWLAGPYTQVLHAGAVAYEGAAALIVGASGVGKSTTVLACAMAGAGFIGDDLVLVESGRDDDNAEPTVHCLFATLKLNADSAHALGVETWPSLGITPKNKAVVAVEHRLQVVRSARIVALIVLDPPVLGRPHPVRIRVTKVLTSIASTALPLACRTSTPVAWLTTTAALARQLPAYRLPVSWALDTLGTAVHQIIAQAAADQAKRRSVF